MTVRELISALEDVDPDATARVCFYMENPAGGVLRYSEDSDHVHVPSFGKDKDCAVIGNWESPTVLFSELESGAIQ